MATLTANSVTLVQGITKGDRDFGYVSGEDGGMFFTWMPTLEETLDSIEEDEQDGDGELDADEVRKFLAHLLPTTSKGRSMWGIDEEYSQQKRFFTDCLLNSTGHHDFVKRFPWRLAVA